MILIRGCLSLSFTLSSSTFYLGVGYELSIQYVEPLSLEEFAIWEKLRDYPPKLKNKKNEVIDLTGLVPRMIGMVVNLAKTCSDLSFEDLFSKFRERVIADMQQKHDEYVDALDKRNKAKFMQMLHKLFVGSETPKIRICDAAYRDRGLLIALNDCSLQFYNSIARDILYNTFSEFEFTEDRINELSRNCWIRFSENYPRLDYAYVDIIGDRWILYLIQASVSSFPVHNRDSAQLELLLTKSETCQLESLLNSFFDDAFVVSPVVDRKGNIVNFTVTDSKGTSCRERICILYVTPLTRSEAKADCAPEFVEFLTFEECPGDLKPYIRQKVRSRRRSRSQRPVERKKSEES
ncbi:hypothetical protein GAYE_SCF67G6877 [Galdieria yellowstonensis]|uniref:Uncharacterized protein n=1 Tax=Galdieria yellowstonensis TaxID=3028027 RepID=A0AAV9INT6_9RHOD|nr:hypothetical protein GAYE_SCF67G6877 [Galdieria yellowstonensis]